jgi:SEC-C motif-containing protein
MQRQVYDIIRGADIKETIMDICPCGSSLTYDACCRPVIKGERPATTAEELMRSRYSAYVMKEIDFLRTSLHPGHRSDFNEKSTRAWAESSEWHSLEILKTVEGGPEDSEGKVEFIATFSDKGTRKEHHELSSFRKENGMWYLVKGETLPAKQVVRSTPKTGRNDPCPCGSGKKFKKCCADRSAS